MEKRRVTVMIGGHACSFYTDDPEEHISALEKRANAVMKQTAPFSGSSTDMNAVLSVVFLTDALLRAEKKVSEASEKKELEPAIPPDNSAENKPEPRQPGKKPAPKSLAGPKGQVSMWDLLDKETP